jgi:hypothetical protein
VCENHPESICYVPHSCKSRFCSVCGKISNDKTASKLNDLFPNCSYFHVVFTIPSQFRTLLFEKRYLLNACFRATADTLLSFCREQGFEPALTEVLHTFGSDLKRHIHFRVILSSGGLALKEKQKRYTRIKKKNGKVKKRVIIQNNPRWIIHNKFPYRMLHKRFQALLIKELKAAVHKHMNEDPDLQVFSDPNVEKYFFDDLKELYNNGFYVHISKERVDSKKCLEYIARYAKRPPMSEIRIKHYDGKQVTFEYKDYHDPNRSIVTDTVDAIIFLRRLVRHIPPHYFNVIRHYGIIASRVKSKYKKIVDKLL